MVAERFSCLVTRLYFSSFLLFCSGKSLLLYSPYTVVAEPGHGMAWHGMGRWHRRHWQRKMTANFSFFFFSIQKKENEKEEEDDGKNTHMHTCTQTLPHTQHSTQC